MTRLRVAFFRVAGFFGLFRDDTDIRGEVDTHVEMLAEEYIQRGMSPDEAWATARRSFGGVEQVMETYRDQRGLPTLDALVQDARYSVRSLLRTPLFTGIALLTIVVAVAANGALFSLLNALLLRDLAVRDPSTLVQVSAVTAGGTETGFSYAMFEELSRQQQAFSQVAGWWGMSTMKLESDRGLARAVLFGATPNLFPDLGVEPYLGRVLHATDMRFGMPHLEHVVVLGYDFWRRHFNADPSIVGQAVRIEGVSFTVIGVTSPAFSGISLTQAPELIVPLLAVQVILGQRLEALPARPAQWIRVLARLGPDVTLAQARGQVETLWPAVMEASVPASLTAAQRREFELQKVAVSSAARGIEPQLRAQFTQPLLIVLGIAGLVLLIACVNLASLLLARTASRGHEIATRLALGATTWRVSRQIVMESVILTLAGGAIAVVVSTWASEAISRIIFADYIVPATFNSAPDWRVAAAILTVSVAIGILFSVTAIWWVARRPPTEALRANSRTVVTTGRAGAWLVGAQVALSLILVIHAGLLVRSLGAVRAIETGIDAGDVLVTFTTDRPGGYNAVDNATYYPQLMERLMATPGVREASVSLLKPGGGGRGRLEGVRREGADTPAVEATTTPVAPRFFATLGITVLSGRDLTWNDTTASQPVALISASLAGRLFAAGEALGARVNVGSAPRLQNVEIVGVVADSRLYDPKYGNTDAVYIPALQDPNANYKCLVIRGDAVSPRDVQQAVESLGHELILSQQSLNDIISRTLLRERLTAAVGGFFGLLAIALAAIGLYGLMAYTVGQGRREAGIRLALGARPGQLTAAIFRHAIQISLTGVAVGSVLGLASVGAVRTLLFGISAHDPVTFLAASLLMTSVALLAAAGPALRLGRTDPVIALREN